MKQHSRYLPYTLLAACHMLIAIVAFKAFWHDRDGISLCAYGDGMKNNFTLLTYTRAPVTSEGIFKYDAMNYPFGEYVYTTDNTPLFSIPFRFFCQYIKGLSGHTLAAYSVFIIANFISCGLLLFFIFRRLLRNNWLSFLMALWLPWTNVQVHRVARGHFNLSLSSLVVAVICLIIVWTERRRDNKSLWPVAVAMTILIIAGFLAHGYYLAILGCFLFFILLADAYYHRREKAAWRPSLIAAFLVPGTALILCLALLKGTDGYIAQRSGRANKGQTVELAAMVSPYKFISVPFPFHQTLLRNDAENAAYLGGIGLFTLLFLMIAALFSKKIRAAIIAAQRSFFRDPLLAAIFWGGFFFTDDVFRYSYQYYR